MPRFERVVFYELCSGKRWMNDCLGIKHGREMRQRGKGGLKSVLKRRGGRVRVQEGIGIRQHVCFPGSFEKEGRRVSSSSRWESCDVSVLRNIERRQCKSSEGLLKPGDGRAKMLMMVRINRMRMRRCDGLGE